MIYETVITTVNKDKDVHIAPMGIRQEQGLYVIAPFRPSATLRNMQETGNAVINLVDDVRIIAGCLTGRRSWALKKPTKVEGMVLDASLSHVEVKVETLVDDELRPSFHCRKVHEVSHSPFMGFNRAQAAVLEAAILMSRLEILPPDKIKNELSYLEIAIEKTAGFREKIAWQWLMEKFDAYFQEQNTEVNV
ncbi:MAG: DUF447 family protein [Gammaproteobacteria bacterium]|nr:DUF447 family protein [Gammaproteobacteria bacterium]